MAPGHGPTARGGGGGNSKRARSGDGDVEQMLPATALMMGLLGGPSAGAAAADGDVMDV